MAATIARGMIKGGTIQRDITRLRLWRERYVSQAACAGEAADALQAPYFMALARRNASRGPLRAVSVPRDPDKRTEAA